VTQDGQLCACLVNLGDDAVHTTLAHCRDGTVEQIEPGIFVDGIVVTAVCHRGRTQAEKLRVRLARRQQHLYETAVVAAFRAPDERRRVAACNHVEERSPEWLATSGKGRFGVQKCAMIAEAPQ
jgi:hypothetical protein